MEKTPSFKLKMYPGLVFLVFLLSWSPVNVHVRSCGNIPNTIGASSAETYEDLGRQGHDRMPDSFVTAPSVKGHATSHIRPHYPILFH